MADHHIGSSYCCVGKFWLLLVLFVVLFEDASSRQMVASLGCMGA